MVSADLALQCAAICAAAGIVMTTLESLWHWRLGHFDKTGIWPWYILREDHNPRAAALLTPVLDGAGLAGLFAARLVAAGLVPLCYGLGWNAAAPLFILIATQSLLAWRCRLGGEGGDQMTTIMLATALIPQVLPAPAAATAAALFVAAQISLSYVASGSAKLFGPLWRRGEALVEIMGHFQFGNFWLMRHLRAHPALCRLICAAVIGFQVSFPLFFVLPAPIAYGYLLAGVAFHVGIAFFMRLYLFVLTFLGTYPCLIFGRHMLRQLAGL